MQIKTTIILIMLFILINSAVYAITNINERKVYLSLQDTLQEVLSELKEANNISSDLFSYVAIRNKDNNKTVAWIVSFEDDDFIALTLKSGLSIRVLVFIISMLLIYFILLQIKSKQLIISNLQKIQVLTEQKMYTDGLTSVYNRNKFDEVFKEELGRVRRYKHKLTLAIIDIDKFKKFNDTYGHLIGDEILITIAQNLNNNVRTTDTFARWGGEEFVILFKETSLEDALSISQKLKNNIQNLKSKVAGGVTASFGITEYIHGDTKETMFKRCDDALYNAKEHGRNRIEIL